MSTIPELLHYPEVHFTDSKGLEDFRDEMLKNYSQYFEENNLQIPQLEEGDPVRVLINSISLMLFQLKAQIEATGRSNLLRYAYGDALENLGALKGIRRRGATKSKTILKFSINEPLGLTVPIPKGTEVSTEDDISFETDEYAEIIQGKQFVTVSATALETGPEPNTVLINSINTMIDPVPYIDKVTNITKAEGGAWEEDDESLTLRIFKAPDGYSVAGPAEAYVAKAIEFGNDVEEALATSPSPCNVEVIFIKKGGKIPDNLEMQQLQKVLSDQSMRPLGDRVVVKAPTEVNYDVDLTYFISKSEEESAEIIKDSVNSAVEKFLKWQRKLGRDINPSELIKRVVDAGAKRVEVTSPDFLQVDKTSISKINNMQVNFGGIEDD